jgi:subtilase family serine protease
VGTAPARYYILAKADGDDGTAETSETNNVLARSITVTAP